MEDNINEIYNYYLINDEIINHIATLRDLRLMSRALVNKKMGNLKTKMLLKMVNGIIIEYPNTNDLIQQKLIEKCDKQGISIDKVIFFFLVSLEAKNVYKPSMLYIKVSICC